MAAEKIEVGCAVYRWNSRQPKGVGGWNAECVDGNRTVPVCLFFPGTKKKPGKWMADVSSCYGHIQIFSPGEFEYINFRHPSSPSSSVSPLTRFLDRSSWKSIEKILIAPLYRGLGCCHSSRDKIIVCSNARTRRGGYRSEEASGINVQREESNITEGKINYLRDDNS